jgi:hypothetical protein
LVRSDARAAAWRSMSAEAEANEGEHEEAEEKHAMFQDG